MNKKMNNFVNAMLQDNFARKLLKNSSSNSNCNCRIIMKLSSFGALTTLFVFICIFVTTFLLV